MAYGSIPTNHKYCMKCGAKMQFVETNVSYQRDTGRPIKEGRWTCGGLSAYSPGHDSVFLGYLIPKEN